MADMSLERYYIIYGSSYLAPFIGIITVSPDPLQYGHRELSSTSNSASRLFTGSWQFCPDDTADLTQNLTWGITNQAHSAPWPA